MTPPEEHLGRRVGELIGLTAAVLLHLVVGWFHLTSGLVAPPWAVVLLNVEWLALAVAIWRFRHRPPVALSVPFVSAGILLIVLWFGGAVLGWSA